MKRKKYQLIVKKDDTALFFSANTEEKISKACPEKMLEIADEVIGYSYVNGRYVELFHDINRKIGFNM